MSTFARPPIESMRPVVSFAVIRLLLPVAALAADVILGFPDGARPVILGRQPQQRFGRIAWH